MDDATPTPAQATHEALLRVRAARRMLDEGDRALMVGIDPVAAARDLLLGAQDILEGVR